MLHLTDIFGHNGDLTIAQESVRAVLIFAYGLAALRITGRRVFGKWSALDIVVSIIVGSNLSRTMTGNAPLAGTLAATTLLLAIHYLLARWAASSSRASRWLEGNAIDIGPRDAVADDARKRHLVSEADLQEALRQAGLETSGGARKMTLEPSGKITVLK